MSVKDWNLLPGGRMNGSFTIARRALLGLACAASLGFGTAQAFAKPGAAVSAVPLCSVNDPNSTVCNSECKKKGYSGGWCDETFTYCSCYRVPPPVY
jgi:hypothetical protein